MQLEVAGFVVRLEGAGAAETADLAAALSGGRPSRSEARFVIRSEHGAVPRPHRPADRTVQHLSFWAEDDAEVVATESGATARVWAGHALLDCGVGGVRAVHALLLPVLALLVGQADACLAHGAAVRVANAQDSSAVLVLGGSGHGKSTLVVAALTSGLGVLSDDLLVLRCRQGQLEVSGVPQPLALPDDQQHLEVVGAAIPDDPRNRRTVAAGQLLVSGRHVVSSVLLVEHSERPDGHLLSAEPGEILRWVLASTVEGLSAHTAHRSFPYAAAASTLPGWRLGHAADPTRRVPAAAERLRLLSPSRVPVG